MFDAIPQIDFSPARDGDPAGRRRLAAEIGAACASTGFFLLTGHGLAPAAIAAQFGWTKRFFDLPPAEKQALRFGPERRGYEGLGAQTLDATAAPDRKEAYYCGIDWPADHPYVVAGLDSYGRNRWPTQLPGFAEATAGYIAIQIDLALEVMRLIALSLDLAEEHFTPLFHEPIASLRLIRYPAQAPDEAGFGAGAHTDWGAVTLLAQDDAGGLEVLNPAGRWIPVPPVPDAFVVNMGDLIPRWTGGRYRSIPHRVINRSGRQRHSMPFFLSPNFHARIEALPGCAEIAPACTAGEHITEMARKTYGRAA